MSDHFHLPSSDDFVHFRRSRAMTEPFHESNENGMPAVCYRSSSEDENTNDSGISMTFDHKQPTDFTEAFNFEKDLDATPRVRRPHVRFFRISPVCVEITV
ncbi:hypothetical protein L596_011082 [Steinernema carpocapsae]|uniref:Uncharacterized protein n=1 Tax=Steinernema carpocapsae TaxID=34508 RepID=A0A4U5NSE3_STECR|nr:hypothetical protein L596_011082 [Steinernema carpocapsae]